jgi:periplasmic protein TonB
MKNPFYFLFFILIFLTACKQEPKNSVDKIPVSENEKSILTDDTIPKIEKEKKEQKADAKKQNKSLPFLPPPIAVFDEYEPPLAAERIDEYQPSGNVYNPDGIQEGDVVQEEPSGRTNLRANNQDEPYTFVDENAEFPGGKIKFDEYIEKNMKLTSEMEVSGKCYLRFVVGLDGSISNVVILKGVIDCPDCDKEAKRLVQNMPNWIPAKFNGQQVKSYYVVPIKFLM